MKLDTIQKFGNLNKVHKVDSHRYEVISESTNELIAEVQFQNGPRNDEGSIPGVLMCDLLEMCRDQLIGFQKGEFSTIENEMALHHIAEALLWLNKRAEDRLVRGVLGTMEK